MRGIPIKYLQVILDPREQPSRLEREFIEKAY